MDRALLAQAMPVTVPVPSGQLTAAAARQTKFGAARRYALAAAGLTLTGLILIAVLWAESGPSEPIAKPRLAVTPTLQASPPVSRPGPMPPGTVAQLWSHPAGMSAQYMDQPRVGQPIAHQMPWWGNASLWAEWEGGLNTRDARWLRALTGVTAVPRANGTAQGLVLVYVQHWIAAVQPSSPGAPTMLSRLRAALQFFREQGLQVGLLVGRPDFCVNSATPADPSTQVMLTCDPVHDRSAREHLLQNLHTIWSATHAELAMASVYWMGASMHCTHSSAPCSEDDILQFNAALAGQAAEFRLSYYVHVDGPFWEGCAAASTAQRPCAPEELHAHGYTPRSMLAPLQVAGVLGESWVQGSLRPGVHALSNGSAPWLPDNGLLPHRLLLLSDVPNCDLPGTPACATGSVEQDCAAWLQWTLQDLQLSSWGVWEYSDNCGKDSVPSCANRYGDVARNGTALTRKGQLHAAKASAPWR